MQRVSGAQREPVRVGTVDERSEDDVGAAPAQRPVRPWVGGDRQRPDGDAVRCELVADALEDGGCLRSAREVRAVDVQESLRSRRCAGPTRRRR